MGARRKVKKKVAATNKVALKKPAGQAEAAKKFLHRELFERSAIEGMRPAELCAELGVSRDTLERVTGQRLLLLLRRKKTALLRMGAYEKEQLAKELYRLRLAYLWREALCAWRKSLVDQATEKQSAGSESERTETTLRPQTGDARYLQFAWRMAEETYRLDSGNLPAHAAAKSKPGDADLDEEQESIEQAAMQQQKEHDHDYELSPEQRRAIARGFLAALHERSGATSATRTDGGRELSGATELAVGAAPTLA